MADTATPQDNRRIVVRVFSQQILQVLTEWARRNGEDLISVIIFTAIWTANTAHIAPQPSLRYSTFRDIPPDSLRRPVLLSDLPDMVCLPRATVAVYVKDLVSRDLIEMTPSGMIVPAAVLARMNSLENLAITYDRVAAMVAALHEAGMPLDESPAADPN